MTSSEQLLNFNGELKVIREASTGQNGKGSVRRRVEGAWDLENFQALIKP